MIQKLWGFKMPEMVHQSLNFHNFCYVIYMKEIKIYLESARLEHLYSNRANFTLISKIYLKIKVFKSVFFTDIN